VHIADDIERTPDVSLIGVGKPDCFGVSLGHGRVRSKSFGIGLAETEQLSKRKQDQQMRSSPREARQTLEAHNVEHVTSKFQ
jgi:hypothetical protein